MGRDDEGGVIFLKLFRKSLICPRPVMLPAAAFLLVEQFNLSKNLFD